MRNSQINLKLYIVGLFSKHRVSKAITVLQVESLPPIHRAVLRSSWVPGTHSKPKPQPQRHSNLSQFSWLPSLLFKIIKSLLQSPQDHSTIVTAESSASYDSIGNQRSSPSKSCPFLNTQPLTSRIQCVLNYYLH